MDQLVLLLDYLFMFSAVFANLIISIGFIALIVSVFSKKSKKVPFQILGVGIGLLLFALATIFILEEFIR